MAAGNFTWFDRALKKIADGTINMNGTSFKVALLASTQAISQTFVGSSGDCRFADLTAELATANGYTNGGLALTSETLTRSGPNVTFTADPWTWTITGAGITFKYLVMWDDGATNKDLVCFVDLDTGGGSVTAPAGALTFNPSSGIVGWHN